jgi:hypothetical protein
MKTAQSGWWRFVALGLLVSLALPWPAMAQARESSAIALDSDPDAAAHAAADRWFREEMEPRLRTLFLEEGRTRGPVLYDPNESAPMPGRPIPERRAFSHRAAVGTAGVVVLAGDLPPTRSEWSDVRDWNDPLWPAEMFRFYFERVPPAPPLRPTAQ